MAHIHARSKEGKATTGPEVFREITHRIREKGCDIILEFSSSPGREPNANVEDGFRVLEANPEMASVDIGVVVFMRAGEEQITPWTRSFDEKITRAIVESGIKPEFEVYGFCGDCFAAKRFIDAVDEWINASLENINILHRYGRLTKQYF